MDFTDPSHPFEIAYFDRGPIDAKTLVLGGEWSAYWYNGHIYGSEIARGLDIFELTPTKFLTQSEIDAAKTVRVAELNVQDQQKVEWGSQLVVAQAYLDQLTRSQALPANRLSALTKAIQHAEGSHLSPKDMSKLQSMAPALAGKRRKPPPAPPTPPASKPSPRSSNTPPPKPRLASPRELSSRTAATRVPRSRFRDLGLSSAPCRNTPPNATPRLERCLFLQRVAPSSQRALRGAPLHRHSTAPKNRLRLALYGSLLLSASIAYAATHGPSPRSKHALPTHASAPLTN